MPSGLSRSLWNHLNNLAVKGSDDINFTSADYGKSWFSLIMLFRFESDSLISNKWIIDIPILNVLNTFQ